MEQKRTLLYLALMAVVFFIWQAWEKDYPPAATTNIQTTQSAAVPTNIPPMSARQQASNIPVSNTAIQPTSMAEAPALITVNTDVIHAKIDTHGGNFVLWNLPKYPAEVKTPDVPVQLLNPDPDKLYIAESGLIGTNGPDTQEGQVTFTAAQNQYTLSPQQKTLDVKLSWQNKEGLQVDKIYTFERGKYNVVVRYEIHNTSTQPWTGQLYAQLRQKPTIVSSSIFGLHTFQGVALSNPAAPYEKLSFSNLDKDNIDRTVQGGWLAMQQRYFLSAWVPPQSQTSHYYTRVDSNKVYTAGYVGPVITVPAKGTTTTDTTFYAGPEIPETLKSVAPNLDLTIDYGWLWPISVVIFWIMKHIHTWIGNWGWSIVLVTLLIKLAFYKLSETSYRSMAKMRRLTPHLQAIKDRYGDDKQKMSQATMELYKKEKVNPMGGCLPMIVQIPFFIALYYVLIESVELRQAPFILWIHDLSAQDPYYVLPILMGISMFVQQRLNPPPADPMQAKVFMFLPVVFTVFFFAFPAGLVLYWLVNNCLSVLQQWYIMRQGDKKKVVTVKAN